jgi:Fe-S cluster assembly ATPase SufC
VHVLQDGRIIQSGDKTLAAELERRGYGTFAEAPEVAEHA